MNCQLCRRELTATETVWRYYFKDPDSGRLLSICDKCFSERERDFRDKVAGSNPALFGNGFNQYLNETWREPLPCEQCGRPVRIPQRYKRERIVCGKACQAVIFNAQSRMRRALGPRPCAVCGQSFTPKRSDSRYCSVACKQSAYRRRNTVANA